MKKKITIQFLGDISLNHRYGDGHLNRPFADFINSLPPADYRVGNLEALLPGDEGFNLKKLPYLFAEEAGFKHLEELKLNLVSTAHNHVYDTFDSGYAKTRSFLEGKGIAVVGSSLRNDDHRNAFITDIFGTRIGFLNYCHKDTHFVRPEHTDIRLNEYDAQTILNDIENLKKQADYIVLMLHWGGKTDYGFLPSMEQREDAKKFIERGADCIIGHHAHCIQAVEQYKGKPIFYCLGNFCFDDIRSHGQVFPIRKSGKRGILAQVVFYPEKKKVRFSQKGLQNKNLRIEPSVRAYLSVMWIKPLWGLYKIFPPFRKLYAVYLRKIEPLIFHYEISDKNIFQKIMSLDRNKISYFYRKIFK